MKKLCALAASTIILSACGSVPVLDANSAAVLKGKTVVRAIPPGAKFQITTPGKVLIGARLTDALTEKGATESLSVADPSLEIAAQLAGEMDQRYGTRTVGTILPQVANNLAELSALAQPHADYALQVRTPTPSMIFYTTSPSRYRVMFMTFASLIDVRTQKSVSWAVCNYFPESLEGAATYEEMFRDDSKRLKQDMSAGIRHCVQELKKKLFTI